MQVYVTYLMGRVVLSPYDLQIGAFGGVRARPRLHSKATRPTLVVNLPHAALRGAYSGRSLRAVLRPVLRISTDRRTNTIAPDRTEPQLRAGACRTAAFVVWAGFCSQLLPNPRGPRLCLPSNWVYASPTRAATNTIAKARVAYPVTSFPNFWWVALGCYTSILLK